ncbi:MAG TPA: hypothetical protein VNK52_06210 [Hyphomicrobiaceae bacterium]|nr:hypothetical protein [Hyphomicrobiaceae bacterium]
MPFIVLVAALLYSLAIIATAVEVNRPFWRLDCGNLSNDTGPVAIHRNMRLLALVYGWGAVAMFAVYGFSGVRWQHGWQYGSALALIAFFFLLYVHISDGDRRRLRTRRAMLRMQRLTLLHGACALAGLGYLVLSGKMWSTRADWPGSVIFLAGSLAVAALCLISAHTQSQIAARADGLGPQQSDAANGA